MRRCRCSASLDGEEAALIKPVARALLLRDALRANDYRRAGIRPRRQGDPQGRGRGGADRRRRSASAGAARAAPAAPTRSAIRCSRRCARGAANWRRRRRCRPMSSSTIRCCARWRTLRPAQPRRAGAHHRRRRAQAGGLWRRVPRGDPRALIRDPADEMKASMMADIRKIDDRISVAPQITPSRTSASIARRRLRRDRQQPPRRRGSRPARGRRDPRGGRGGGAGLYRDPDHPCRLLAPAGRGDGRGARRAGGPVLAYCRSGTRSCNLWALAPATAAAIPDELIAKGAGAGYDLTGIRPLLDALAARHDELAAARRIDRRDPASRRGRADAAAGREPDRQRRRCARASPRRRSPASKRAMALVEPGRQRRAGRRQRRDRACSSATARRSRRAGCCRRCASREAVEGVTIETGERLFGAVTLLGVLPVDVEDWKRH